MDAPRQFVVGLIECGVEPRTTYDSHRTQRICKGALVDLKGGKQYPFKFNYSYHYGHPSGYAPDEWSTQGVLTKGNFEGIPDPLPDEPEDFVVCH